MVFNYNLRKLCSLCFKGQRYDVTKEKIEHGKVKKTIKIVVVLWVVLVFVACLAALWLYLASRTTARCGNDCDSDLLYKHRQYIETRVQQWLQERTNSSMEYMTSYTISQRGFIIQEIVQKLAIWKNASLEQLQSDNGHQDMFRYAVQDLCLPETVCADNVLVSPYRTSDGSCNNIGHPEWGMTGRPQRRSLPATYSDGLGVPRMFGFDGKPLPSPREISNTVHTPTAPRRTDEQSTVLVMAFGQFLSHDTALTTPMDGQHSSSVKCCDKEQTILSGPFKTCFPIHLPAGDMYFRNSSCMEFTRSAPAVCNNCEICGRQQINEMTSYIDASQVYGTTDIKCLQLRTFTGGLLKASKNDNLLPEQAMGSCRITGKQQYCFNAGDRRVNVIPNLSTLHTVFVRLHNMLAILLRQHNPQWADETLYQEARKILIALMQHIVYNEYMPAILGNDAMIKYKLEPIGASVSNKTAFNESIFNDVYDSQVDATTSNAFSTAAFRFGHMHVPDIQVSLNDGYAPECVAPVEDTYHNPNMTFLYCDGLTRWMVHNRGLKSNGLFSKGVRNLLFIDKKNVSFDLVAINIQRGRDHGLPSYNKWRQFCNLPMITGNDFNNGGTAMGNFSAENADQFRSCYRHEDDIDLYSGAVKENVLPGAQVGPTFACILAREFRHLKIGDRFYYENARDQTGFTISLSVNGVTGPSTEGLSVNGVTGPSTEGLSVNGVTGPSTEGLSVNSVTGPSTEDEAMQFCVSNNKCLKVTQWRAYLVDEVLSNWVQQMDGDIIRMKDTLNIFTLNIFNLVIDQLFAIKKMRFAKILCETMNVSRIQMSVFKPPDSTRNPLVNCEDIPDIDIKHWTDHGRQSN